ncbi:MAG: flagellar hook-length control protein FliK [Deltaproteobacteria bacterium]
MALGPVHPGIAAKISSALEITRSNLPLSNLVPGEILTINVVEKISARQYLLTLKDASMTAMSELPLKTGEKLLVKVQAVQPQIILSLVDGQKQSTDSKINEALLQWRSHPDSLIRLLGKIPELSAHLQSGDLSSGITRKDMDTLMNLFRGIVFSSQTKTNPLFVKDFVSRLGLLLESDLSKMALRSLKDRPSVLTDNLKASFIKLSAVIAEAMKDGSRLDAQALARLTNMASFTNEALQTIESRQAVNIIYQQNESGLYLQIPLAIGQMLRQADIFITPDDKNTSGSQKYSSCSIRIFLDLDYLGEMAIDASVREGRIRCLIKCESEAITELVSASAQKLKEALGTIGYGIEQLDCLQSSELAQKRVEYIEQQILGSTDLVNHFI